MLNGPKSGNLDNPPANDQTVNLNNKSKGSYKNYTSKIQNYCPYQCSSCKTVGNSLLKIQFDDFKHILLEDDPKLIYNFFGRELVK